MTRNVPAPFHWRALLFVLAGAFHLWFNWRTLWFYVRSRLAEGVRAKRELALATAAVVAVAGDPRRRLMV